jgi:hypothetical protein
VFKFCKNDDKRIAIGTGVRPIEFCRPCYVTTYGAEFEAWKVVTPYEDVQIACAKTGEDIERGGTVWLDPVETNIPALVYGGFIEAIPEAKAPAAKTARTTEA